MHCHRVREARLASTCDLLLSKDARWCTSSHWFLRPWISALDCRKTFLHSSKWSVFAACLVDLSITTNESFWFKIIYVFAKFSNQTVYMGFWGFGDDSLLMIVKLVATLFFLQRYLVHSSTLSLACWSFGDHGCAPLKNLDSFLSTFFLILNELSDMFMCRLDLLWFAGRWIVRGAGDSPLGNRSKVKQYWTLQVGSKQYTKWQKGENHCMKGWRNSNLDKNWYR